MILFLTIFFFQSSIANAADPILENADSVFFALNTELEKPTVKPLPKPMVNNPNTAILFRFIPIKFGGSSISTKSFPKPVVNNPNAAILFRINQPIEFGGLSTSTRPLIINPSSAIIKPLIFPKNLLQEKLGSQLKNQSLSGGEVLVITNMMWHTRSLQHKMGMLLLA